jgi:membrane-bound lytic murein transglycosylase D
MKKNIQIIIGCIGMLCCILTNPAMALDTDTTKPKQIASILKTDKLTEGQKKLAKAFTPTDSSRLTKRVPTFTTNKNASKSAQDPNALSFGNFKVSPDLYGKFAPYIVEYVKNYNNNFGPRMSRIKAANKGYFTMIDNTMRKNGIPKEFHSLAVIESALNPNATSGVGAAGPWQFMPGTAEMLGLIVSEEKDERRDFYKSTQAAAKYVKRLHNMFHDWLLVVASYNCGPAPVLRHLAKTGGKSYWDIKQYLPAETQNHVMAFIAASVFYDKNTKVLDLGNLPKDAKKIGIKEMGKGGKEYKENHETKTKVAVNKDEDNDLNVADDDDDDKKNKPQILPEEQSQIITLKVKGAYKIEVIAEMIGADVAKLKRWNPRFNELAAVLGSNTKLTIPSAKLDNFIIKKESILAQSMKADKPAIVPNASASKSNDDKTTKPSTETKPVKKAVKLRTHKVLPGETLSSISDEYGVSMNEIMKKNNLKSKTVSVNQILQID